MASSCLSRCLACECVCVIVCVCVPADVCLLFARSTSGVFKCDEIFMELRSAAA